MEASASKAPASVTFPIKSIGTPNQTSLRTGEKQMAKSLTPLHDRVVIRRITEVESVRGGIIIPDTAKEKPQEGVVVAVGTGKFEKGQTVPLAVKAGDHVLFGKYAGTEIK